VLITLPPAMRDGKATVDLVIWLFGCITQPDWAKLEGRAPAASRPTTSIHTSKRRKSGTPLPLPIGLYPAIKLLSSAAIGEMSSRLANSAWISDCSHCLQPYSARCGEKLAGCAAIRAFRSDRCLREKVKTGCHRHRPLMRSLQAADGCCTEKGSTE
jgi:hypothetical protein